MNLAFSFIVPLLLTLAITPWVIQFARNIGCIDHPGVRRFHDNPTPRLGGLAFFLGTLPFFFFLEIESKNAFFVGGLFLLVLGAIDDWRGLGWKWKFAGIILASSVAIFGGDIVIRQIGEVGTIGKIELGYAAVPFTFFAIVGLTNALNLIDGLNGLATGISILGFFFMGFAAFLSGNMPFTLLAAGFLGTLAGFFFYNFPRARIFMGDTGSLFLGYSLAVSAIILTQNPTFQIAPLFPVLVLIIPIFDALRVMAVRAFYFKNPFQADKTHLHHLLVRKALPPTSAVIFIWTMTLIFGFTSLILLGQNAMAFVMVILLVCILLSFYINILTLRPRRRRKSREVPFPKQTFSGSNRPVSGGTPG